MNSSYETNPCRDVDLTAFWAEAVKAKSILGWIVDQSGKDAGFPGRRLAPKSTEDIKRTET